MSRETLKRLEAATLVALRIDGDDWSSGLLRRDAPIPDAWMGLVESADGRRRFAPAGETPRVGRGDHLLLVRKTALAIPIALEDAPAASGESFQASCEVLLRWPAREIELSALRGVVPVGVELHLAQLGELVSQRGASAALRQFVATKAAEALLGDQVREDLLAFLRAQLRPLLFELGAEIERLGEVRFASEAYRRRRLRERESTEQAERIRARQVVEQAALVATNRRLEDLSGLLEKLRGLSRNDAEMRWHDLLPALSPAERGKLLENLWRITPDRRTSAAIVAIAGGELLWLDPADPRRVLRRGRPGEQLGGLRSLSFCPDRHVVAAGAASGVWLLDAETGAPRACLAVPDAEGPRTGFNAAVMLADRLFATHSQLGCWSWAIEPPGDARPILRPMHGTPRTIRAACAGDDGALYFAADDCVQRFDPASGELRAVDSADDIIHSLAMLGNRLYVGTERSLLCQDLARPGDWWVLRRSGEPIESVQPRRWNDLVELVLPAGADGVCGLYGEEGVTARLLESTAPIRRVWAADDLVVGLTEARDRLVVMNASLPARQGRDVSIGRMTGHSVQDACIVTKAAASEAKVEG